MSQEKVLNRWYVVIGAVLIQLCLGAIYAWSVFTPKLTEPFEKGGMYGFSATQAAWIFSVGLLVFSVVMIISGRMIQQNRSEKTRFSRRNRSWYRLHSWWFFWKFFLYPAVFHRHYRRHRHWTGLRRSHCCGR